MPPEADSRASEFGSLLKLRGRVNEAIEPLRAAGRIGKSLDAAVTLRVPDGDPMREALEKNLGSLPEIFIVSDVKFRRTAEPGDPFSVGVQTCCGAGTRALPPLLALGPRACIDPALGEVCPRCAEALKR